MKLITDIIKRNYNNTARLELNTSHMVASLENVRKALQNCTMSAMCYWLDITVTVYWISNNKEWKQFFYNRITKISQKKDVTLRH